MTAPILAVYENGVLRPIQPLPFAEGETVEIVLARPRDSTLPVPEEEAVKRIHDAKTMEEWVEAANAAPLEEDGYDLLEALERNRYLAGDQRGLFPAELKWPLAGVR